MKIIDLAEKQKNNEMLPKHIRYENEDLYFDGVTYYDAKGNVDLLDILAMNNNALTHLYDKVEVIEEEKEIPEKYDTGLHNGRWTRDSIKDGMEKDNMSLEDIVIEMGKEQTLIKEKLFEILDYLKSKGDE